MKKIIYIPLDERPCNFYYNQLMIKNTDIDLVVPPLSLLGKKKISADTEKLWQWLKDNIIGADYLIASIDMIVYGGIVPSRIHHMDQGECTRRLNNIKELKKINNNLKIFAFNLIMRVPSYNSSDEEPDYYDTYGERIFKYSYLKDKYERGLCSEDEHSELIQAENSIPNDILNDYKNRRATNSSINNLSVDLVEEGIIDHLVIPLDDCSEYGFSSQEQQILLKKVEEKVLQDVVYIYPGADEVGLTLLSRALCELNKIKPRIFVRYSSTNGPVMIPKYEDRYLNESIKSQIISAGAVMVDNSNDADIVLMVNSPEISGFKMGEAPDALKYKDRSYYSMRNLREFIISIKYYLDNNKKVSIADVAFCNGADNELMEMLHKLKLLDKIYSYAGWNTSGNTLGTVITHSIVKFIFNKDIDEFNVLRLLEDWGYQSIVRQELAKYAYEIGAEYTSIEGKTDEINLKAKELLQEFFINKLSVFNDKFEIKSLYFPWKRLFEIGMEIIKKN